MRNKKLLSTVVASTLVATTMAMPVMAADQGSVNVEFTTKTPVIRVVAPTSILAAVDPLEMNTPGSQIHSTKFGLENKSEVPVGIDVKSVVTLGSGVTLVDTKKKAVDSNDSTKAEAWLAVAAETSEGKYIETANKTAGDLTEADKNVATLKTEASESSASQTFYVDKAASATAGYTLIAPVATSGTTAAEYKKDLTYAQVYELTAENFADENALLTKLETSDVYVGTADTDKSTLKLLPAGTTTLDTADKWATSNKYFTAGTDNALTSSTAPITDGKKYVYGEAGAAGEKTSFRYIGKLGSGKTSWSDADVDEMNITYSIYGLTDEKFDAANKQYGLYLAGPQVSVSATGLLSITGLTAEQNYVSSSATIDGQTYGLDTDSAVTWTENAWSAENGGSLQAQFGDVWISDFKASTSSKVTVKLSDDSTIEAVVSIQ